MKRLMLAVVLTILSVSLLPAPTSALGGRCISTTIEVAPVSVSLGNEIQATGHFTNCGGGNLSNVGASAYAYQGESSNCNTQIIPYTLISSIGLGQTVNITGTFTPLCIGDWEAVSSMHPSSLWAYGETDFTVTP